MSNVSFFTHLVVSFFLLLVVLELYRYVLREFGLSARWFRVPTLVFICFVSGISILTLVLGMALGFEEILLAFSLAAGICLSFFHPVAAVSFFASVLLLRPWEMLVDNHAFAGPVPRLLAAIALISWTVRRFRLKQMTFVWNQGLTLFTMLFGWLIFSSLISPFGDENFDKIFKSFTPIYIFCVLLINIIENKKDLTFLIRVLSIAVAGAIAAAIVMTLTSQPHLSEGFRLRGIGLYGNSNDLASLAILAFPFPMVSFLKERRRGNASVMNLIILGILLIGIVMAKTRTGVLAIGVEFLLYIILMSTSPVRVILRSMLLLPFLGLIMMVALQRSESDLEGSTDSRLNYIVAGFRMLKTNPLFGVGVFNYPRLYERFSLLFIETGARTAHSTWILFLSETGPIGLAFFALLFFLATKKAWMMRKSRPEFLIATAGYGIQMSTLSHSYVLHPYLLIFLIISASRVAMDYAVDYE